MNNLERSLKAMQFRMGYDFLPVLESSAPANKHLNILIASTSLAEDDAIQLARIQYAKWFCDDMADHIELTITLHVPANASVTREVFDEFGVEYDLVQEIVENDIEAIAELAMSLDCDLVISAAGEALRELYSDEVGLVSADVAAALHIAEIHLKGFDMPWSFQSPSKNMPWSNFYAMSERDPFERLLTEYAASHAAGDTVYEVMRSIVADAVPALCFSRDRLEFYRQQDRWAQRHELEQQDFSVEYAAFLNHFYLTFYAAVDQVVALVVHLYKMDVDERNIGATYKAFREARAAYPAIDDVFSNKAFFSMYDLPQHIRHLTAHSGPVKPQDVYFGDGVFTNEQLDESAEENGLMDNVRFVKKMGAPQPLVDNALWVAREKSRRILMGPPRRHGVFIRKSKKKGVFYYPDPASDLSNFIAFFDRVLAIVKPWNEPKVSVTPTESEVQK